MSTPVNIDDASLKRRMLTIFFVITAVLISVLAIRSNNVMLIGSVFLLPVGVWMLGNPSWVFVLLYIAGYAQFRLPGLPGEISLLLLMQLALVGILLLKRSITYGEKHPKYASRVWLFLFLLNVFFIISVRGFGVTILGSSAYGGKKYITLIATFFFYYMASSVDLTRRQVKWLLFGGLIASLLPVLAQASLYFSGGVSSVFASFFNISWRDVEQASLLAGETGDVRWSRLREFGAMIVTVSLIWPALRSRKLLRWGLIGLALYLILLSGFRSKIVQAGAIIFVWLIFMAKNRMRQFMLLTALALLGWCLALVVIPFLPFAGQRALSFLPFAADRITDPFVLEQAQHSIDFRVEIWGHAWSHVQEYLFIGRGLLLEVAEWAWLQRGAYGTSEFFYAGHAYHSGPLSLLVDFGILGFVVGTGFLLSICIEGWRGVSEYCSNKMDLIHLCYIYMTISLSYQVFSFYFVYGNVVNNFPEIILTSVLMKVLLNGLKRRDSGTLEGVEVDPLG